MDKKFRLRCVTQTEAELSFISWRLQLLFFLRLYGFGDPLGDIDIVFGFLIFPDADVVLLAFFQLFENGFGGRFFDPLRLYIFIK